MGIKNKNLQNLEVYIIARKISLIAWTVYSSLDWQNKKIIGSQFISSIDSIGANIAEGYGRFHYLDKIKFMYNARGSFNEAIYHWMELLKERKLVKDDLYNNLINLGEEFIPKFNAYINSIYNAKKDL